MARATKRLAALRQNPHGWRIDDLEAVARAYGVRVRRTGGSHVIFKHPAAVENLSVPAARPIKSVYVRRFVALIEQIEASKARSDP